MNKTVEITYKTKHTKVGDIPKDWSLDKLRKNAIVLFSNVDKHIKENEIPVSLCNYQDVYYHDYITSSIPFSAGSVKESEFYKFQLHKGDVIITKDSEDRKDIAVPAYVIEEIPNLICGYHLAILRPNEAHLDGVFLSFLLQSHNINHYFQKLANGVTRFGLTTESIKNALIPIPPLPEQEKIAEILSNLDLAISTTNSLIEEIKLRNKGLAQNLLKGKKRLKGFEGEWNEVAIKDIANRITRKNEELDDTVVTISAQRGLVRQEDFFTKRVASKTLSNYYLIYKGEFAYNKSYSNGYPMGAFKRLDGFEKAVVTTLYICFSLKKIVSSDFMKHFFEAGFMVRPLMKIAQEGGRAHGLLNIGIQDFFGLKLTIPTFKEQQAITSVLSEADKELDLYKKQLNILKKQKKGLMQKLLTGKIRVNIK
ncbi:type I restriction enzyme, S subunit [Sinomicrobium oceani]|uniref:Type I restriction enzyme, S subunit n=1 Tax=Sinomicrobium oceani TaxID=1150368 RepID=A0A1K1RRV6_9FLAO|nr:restriction endonuclease subunit S [Sinomicrobium oceani]SFW74479.1 type I restriction enzyme, S subunit [Sinomicrobium oceani]